MRRVRALGALCALVAATCGRPERVADATTTPEPSSTTTAGSIAIANLDGQIAQAPNDAARMEFLLERSRFLGDYDALDRASRLAEDHSATADDLVRRARARAAVHRFADALRDLAAAEHAGARPEQLAPLRVSILVATGRAAEVVPQLEAAVVRHPGFAPRTALAGAYAAVGRLADADALYAQALADLETTLPFPYAWVSFARGQMWTEQAGDSARGAVLYGQALAYLPEFVQANIHLAELEVARGDSSSVRSAMSRLARVVAASDEPEAVALLGRLHVASGEVERGRREIGHARERFEGLLRRHELAFAEHAAEFYLGVGADAERAWVLASVNVGNRRTARAVALAMRAARATGRAGEARRAELEHRNPQE